MAGTRRAVRGTTDDTLPEVAYAPERFQLEVVVLGRFLSPLAVVTAVLVGAPWSASAAPSSNRAPALVAATATNSPFSPNRDGVKDLGVVRYQLAKRAYVSVRVSRQGRTVLLRRLGRLGAGAHSFVWNGVSNGRVVPDATYAVSVVAQRFRHSKPHATSRTLAVDARYTSLGIGHGKNLSSDVVYPRTTVIHDVVVGVYFPWDKRIGDTSTVRRQVLDSRGRVVDTEPLEPVPEYDNSFRYTWDGRNGAGAIVPAGNYRIRLVQGRDGAGNPRVLQPPQPVSVSTQQLVAQTATISTTARAAEYQNVCFGNPSQPNDCGDRRSRSVVSSRFPDGISYRSEQRTLVNNDRFGPPTYTIFTEVDDIYSIGLTGRSTPYDTFSVTAHGGPATAGDNDVATLRVFTSPDWTGLPYPPTVQAQGDSSTTLSDAHSMGLTRYRESYGGYPSVDPPQLRWHFGTTDGNEYDVSSFDVTYTRYVLAP